MHELSFCLPMLLISRFHKCDNLVNYLVWGVLCERMVDGCTVRRQSDIWIILPFFPEEKTRRQWLARFFKKFRPIHISTFINFVRVAKSLELTKEIKYQDRVRCVEHISLLLNLESLPEIWYIFRLLFLQSIDETVIFIVDGLIEEFVDWFQQIHVL